MECVLLCIHIHTQYQPFDQALSVHSINYVTHARTHTCTHARTHTRTHTHAHACTQHTHAHAHAHTYTHTHTHTHTYTHCNHSCTYAHTLYALTITTFAVLFQGGTFVVACIGRNFASTKWHTHQERTPVLQC